MGSGHAPVILLALLLLTGPAVAAEDAAADPPEVAAEAFQPPKVSFADGLLTVEADDVPLEVILRSIAEEADVEIHGEIMEQREVTVRLDGVPIRQAVDRLLLDQNFTMRYGGDGSLEWITLRGPSLEPVTPKQRRQPQPRNLQALLVRNQIDVPQDIQKQIGGSRVSLSRFLRGIARIPDAKLRAIAIGLFVKAVERGPNMRAALRGMNAQALERFGRRYLGSKGAELVRVLSVGAQDPGVRARAKTAVARIDKASGG